MVTSYCLNVTFVGKIINCAPPLSPYPQRTLGGWHNFGNNVAGSLQANPYPTIVIFWVSLEKYFPNVIIFYFVILDSQSNPCPAFSDLKWSITSSNRCNSSSLQLKLIAFSAFCSSDALFFLDRHVFNLKSHTKFV